MTNRTRRLARLFYCLISALVLLALPLRAADPAKTVVADTIYRADGSTAKGTLLIAWPAFSTADGKPVAAGSMSVKIGANGAVNIPLIPTEGARPSGTAYKVVIALDDGSSSTEYWSVPALSPATIAAIRATQVPATLAMQVVSRDYVDGQLATAVRKNGDETISGIKTFESSPAVPSPSTETAAANKAYVDTAIAAVAPLPSNVLNINKGGTGTNAFTPGRCVRVANDGNSLESAGGDCGSGPAGGDADTLDGLHASQLTNATSIGGVPVAIPTNSGSLLQFTGTGLGWQAKGMVDARDYPGATPAAQIDSACAAAGSGGTVLVPSSMGAGNSTAANCNVVDFRTSPRPLQYLGYAANSGFNVYRVIDTPGGFNAGVRSSLLARYGGSFGNSSQTPYTSGHFECRLRSKGQCTPIFSYGEGLGFGNVQGFNSVVWGQGGGGTPVGIISPMGELIFAEGRSFVGWNGLTSIFKGTVTGSPVPGATVISYTPADGNTTDGCLGDKAHGECVLGERPIYNLNHATNTGTVTGISTTINASDTVAFAGAPYWDAAASPCDTGTGAGVHCDPVGMFWKAASTQEDYATPCSGDDVSFPNDSTKCVGHFFRVAAVIDATHVRLEEGYDTANLNNTWPATYLLVQGGVVSKADIDNNQVTLPSNSYAWANGDTLVQPPYHMGYVYGASITGTKVFKTNGTGWYDSGGLTIGSNGPANMRVGLDMVGNFATMIHVNPGSNVKYGIDIAGTYTGAHLHGGTGMKISWGDDNAYINLGAGNKFQFNSGQSDFGRVSKFTIADGGTYSVIGTLTSNPFYFWTGGTIKGSLDTAGRLNLGEIDNSLGYKFEVIGDAYASGTLRSGAATGTPPLAVNSTTAVTNLNADMVDGKHAAAFALKVASGTAALATSSIAANSCAAAVTVSASGVVSSDVIQWTPNADITAVTGYTPGGTLKIYSYPTADTVNFKVCNADPSNAVTPGAVTLNWEVTR